MPSATDKRASTDNEEGVILTGLWMFANGDQYDGEFFKKDKVGAPIRHGLGTQTSADGTFYTGTWVCDKMHGNGKLDFGNGCFYEGAFEQNLFEGYGRYTWSNGSYYEGNFTQSKCEGLGKFVDTEGQEWIGTFNGKMGLNLRFHLHYDLPEL